MWKNQSRTFEYDGIIYVMPGDMVVSRMRYAGEVVLPDLTHVIITGLDCKTDPPTLLGPKSDARLDEHITQAQVAEWLSHIGTDEYRPIVPTYIVSVAP